MSKHLCSGLLALMAATGISAAHAESGIYFGASVGNARLGLETDDFTVDVEPDDIVNIDDSDIGYKIYGGLKFTLAAVEAAYIDFGSIEDAGASVDLTGFSAFGVLSAGLGPAEVFGKLGGFIWESDLNALEATYDESGFDPAIGIGAAFNLGGIGVRAEYEYFNISEFDDVSMLSIGATYWLF